MTRFKITYSDGEVEFIFARNGEDANEYAKKQARKKQVKVDEIRSPVVNSQGFLA